MPRFANKSHHFIPKAYLSAWTDPATPADQMPYVWLFPRTGGDGRRKSPKNMFQETDMYTVAMPDGSRDLSFEHGLSQLESGMARLREDFVEQRKLLPNILRMKLSVFIAAMHSRTPRFRDHQRQQWQKILSTGDEITKQMATKTPAERARIARLSLPPSGPTMSMEDVQRIVDYPIQSIAPAVIESEFPFLMQMRLTVFCSDPSGQGFITSDAPVVWYDPEAYKRPPMYRGAALMYESLEITMPLSPRRMLFIAHDKPMSKGVKPIIAHDKPMSKGVKPISYTDVSEDVVVALNRRTARFADQEIVVSKDFFDGRWTPGKPRVDIS
ncbi:DUF4238 domain-containing protein [Mesorhizobium sp. AR02]|uniref:DUF4238 domain-containing protein n=1 Tax=Mesorhizobium sp. AR02 TaxID=2865837 RepID=UPI0021603BCD|nr:DUF4238 domain-containing protein [Mesorhizobium sp. AR02]UVK52732.1 DUF4238 domain-containing protein [Mesorhizobium sp. AR02]